MKKLTLIPIIFEIQHIPKAHGMQKIWWMWINAVHLISNYFFINTPHGLSGYIGYTCHANYLMNTKKRKEHSNETISSFRARE
jgi:hypothetical protein